MLPDLKRLGPRLGKRLPAVRKLLAEADGGRLLGELDAKGSITLMLPDGPIALDSDDIQVRLQAKEGWAAAQGHAVVVVLATELTPDLIREGLARELVRTIQDRRKEMGCQFTDRIVAGAVTDSEELRAAIEQFRDYIQGETLAVELGLAAVSGAEPVETTIGDGSLRAIREGIRLVMSRNTSQPERFRIAVLISGGGTTLRNFIEKIAAGQLPVEIVAGGFQQSDRPWAAIRPRRRASKAS